MTAVFYIISSFVHLLLSALSFAMLARAILSWLPLDDDNPIENFLYAVTEPVIFPVRCILERFDAIAEFPIDISFFVTMLLLSILSGII